MLEILMSLSNSISHDLKPQPVRSAQITALRLWGPFWLLSILVLSYSTVLGQVFPKSKINYLGLGDSVIAITFLYVVSLLILFQLCRGLILQKPASPTKFMFETCKSCLSAPVSWGAPTLNFMALLVIAAGFSQAKPLIAVIHPFSWDMTLAKLDRLLHFGVDPWQLTHRLFSSDIAAYFINFTYHSWFFVLFGFIFWSILARHQAQVRAQYLLASMGLWMICGIFLAMFFSSAGPCYYHQVGTTDPQHFRPLMHRLTQMHESLSAAGWSLGLPALKVQEALWANYSGKGDMLGGGISAFPSMHVGTSVIMALVASRLNKWLGMVMWLFAVSILIGSVHLGWHYAVDGYAAILLAIVFWKLSGRLVKMAQDWQVGRRVLRPVTAPL
jgi:PAP2 superfamily